MNKLVAVEGCVLAFRNQAAQGTIQITSVTDCPVSSGGNKAYAGSLAFSISGYTVGSFSQSAPASGTISGSAQKATSQQQPFVLQDDEVEVIITGYYSGSSSTSQVTDTVYVSNPGQNVLKVT